MITLRLIYVSTGTPILMMKNYVPEEDDYPYHVSEIPEMVESMCFLGDFTQRNLATEFRTPDEDIHISRQKL